MKKIKVLIVLVSFICVTAINFSTNFNSLGEKKLGTTSLLQISVANAQGAEYNDPTWADISDWLESIDEWAGVKNAVGEDTPTDQFSEGIHQYLDDWDLTGDPEYGWFYDSQGNSAYEQTDDCDGQPNFC